MTTAPLTSSKNGTQSPVRSKGMDLQTDDFIKMMVTQLQNQDPTDPAKSSDLLAQMSQIGQLQSSTELQSSLKTMTTQNSFSAAASMIGKQVNGLADDNTPVTGLVTSVRMEDDAVRLELDNGNDLALTRITGIAPAAGTSTATPPTTGTTPAPTPTPHG